VVSPCTGVSLSIARGEFVVVLGKSGGGKTSLLNLIGTIDKPTKGHIQIAGKRNFDSLRPLCAEIEMFERCHSVVQASRPTQRMKSLQCFACAKCTRLHLATPRSPS
jgi:ABC-type lipoprotein export system ATPase subunit